MKVDLDHLRRQYAALSDDDLADIHRNDLVEAARACYDEEVARRGPALRSDAQGHVASAVPFDDGDDEEPEWMEGAASAYGLLSRPESPEASKAQEVATILRRAGLPAHVSSRPADAEGAEGQLEYHVLVPGELTLHAASVLDKELFNASVEATWRAYFQNLSDDELQTADTEMLFAGFRDRLKRVTKAYKKEMGRRGFEIPSPKEADPAS